jgi:hypothetical protein
MRLVVNSCDVHVGDIISHGDGYRSYVAIVRNGWVTDSDGIRFHATEVIRNGGYYFREVTDCVVASNQSDGVQ